MYDTKSIKKNVSVSRKKYYKKRNFHYVWKKNLRFLFHYFNYLYTRETPAFGGISLALRGSGAPSALFGAPWALIWEVVSFGGGERMKKNVGVPVAAIKNKNNI